jgi:hypothetical protein
MPSKRRHSRYFRHLQDLPVQGAVVTVKSRMSRCNKVPACAQLAASTIGSGRRSRRDLETAVGALTEAAASVK